MLTRVDDLVASLFRSEQKYSARAMPSYSKSSLQNSYHPFAQAQTHVRDHHPQAQSSANRAASRAQNDSYHPNNYNAPGATGKISKSDSHGSGYDDRHPDLYDGTSDTDSSSSRRSYTDSSFSTAFFPSFDQPDTNGKGKGKSAENTDFAANVFADFFSNENDQPRVHFATSVPPSQARRANAPYVEDYHSDEDDGEDDYSEDEYSLTPKPVHVPVSACLYSGLSADDSYDCAVPDVVPPASTTGSRNFTNSPSALPFNTCASATSRRDYGENSQICRHERRRRDRAHGTRRPHHGPGNLIKCAGLRSVSATATRSRELVGRFERCAAGPQDGQLPRWEQHSACPKSILRCAPRCGTSPCGYCFHLCARAPRTGPGTERVSSILRCLLHRRTATRDDIRFWREWIPALVSEPAPKQQECTPIAARLVCTATLPTAAHTKRPCSEAESIRAMASNIHSSAPSRETRF